MLDYKLYVEPELLERMTPDQANLAQLMSDISEECWCAGWLIGTEFRLWEAITDPEDHYHWGQDIINEVWRNELKALSEKAGGWIVWGEDGQTFVPLEGWRRTYDDTKKPHRRAKP